MSDAHGNGAAQAQTPLKRLELELDEGQRSLEPAADQAQAALTEAMRRGGTPLNTRCGQRGSCNACAVTLLSGYLTKLHGEGPEAVRVNPGESPVTVNACQYAGSGEVRLRVPQRSLLAAEPQVVSDFAIKVPRSHHPLWQRLAFSGEDLQQAPQADNGQGEPDSATLVELLGRLHPAHQAIHAENGVAVPSEAIQRGGLAEVERRPQGWALTGVTPPGLADRPLGAAIDVGTTTVTLMLVDLSSGEVVGRSSMFNEQTYMADDVLTRINLCSTDSHALSKLRHALIQRTLQPMLEQAVGSAGASLEALRCLAVAANTTMLHLLAGVDPTPMGFAPFPAPFLDYRVDDSSDIGLELPRPARLHLLPSVAAYVGADLTAGILATGMGYQQGTCLLVDVGTNGEVILKHGDRIWGCATAAGPAFEGSGLAFGVRATKGAIAHVTMTEEPFGVSHEVIGGDSVKPIGLCGTAYIDFLHQGYQSGLLGETGRLEEDVAGDRLFIAEGFSGNCQQAYGNAFRLAYGAGKEPIAVTESDVAKLLQAKAAIGAGILVLLKQAGLEPEQVDKLYLAGGFGMHMNVDSAIGCGLLPGFSREQVELVGNTSLAGAYLALCDSAALDEIAGLAKRVEVVELNLDPAFEETYIEQLSLDPD